MDLAKALAEAHTEIGLLKQIIRDMKVVCEMAQVEATTLQPRLHEPFAGHQRVIAEKCGDAVAAAQKAGI